MRGADARIARALRVMGGSSPRAWGRCRALFIDVRRQRFIPTCVGQISESLSLRGSYTGSSPRAWGRSQNKSFACFILRFIPTCVGQIRKHASAHAGRSGSSPRAWGRSSFCTWTRWRQTVHPHVRGADCPDAPRKNESQSVHPHVRGADFRNGTATQTYARFIPTCVGQMRWTSPAGGTFARFIPTCVGQIPLASDLIERHLTVHPHVRGADSALPHHTPRR